MHEPSSRLWVSLLLIIVTVVTSSCVKDVLGRPSDSSTLIERVTKEKITGKVVGVGTSYVSIKQSDEDKGDKQTYGETRQIRVDKQTKMDQVALGDQSSPIRLSMTAVWWNSEERSCGRWSRAIM
jgi:hypothetical protein